MEEDEIFDMEEEQQTTVQEVHPVYRRLMDFQYETLPPAAALLLYTFLQCHDPEQPSERRAKYCQMQFSQAPNGGGSGAAGVAQRRVITRTEDRVIGHNIIEKHLMDVENDDRIKQKD